MNDKQLEAFKLFCKGSSGRKIAKLIGVSPSTIIDWKVRFSWEKLLAEAGEYRSLSDQVSAKKEQSIALDSLTQIDEEHKEKSQKLFKQLFGALDEKDFEKLKCLKITIEAFEKLTKLQRKWFRIDGVSTGENRFQGVKFEVVNSNNQDLRDLLNQDEYNWPRPNTEETA